MNNKPLGLLTLILREEFASEEIRFVLYSNSSLDALCVFNWRSFGHFSPPPISVKTLGSEWGNCVISQFSSSLGHSFTFLPVAGQGAVTAIVV